MTTVRMFKQSPLTQGKDEEIAYFFSSTPWGTAPTNVSVSLFNSSGVDVGSINLYGTPSVLGDVITLPVLKALTAGEYYRLEVKFTCQGNVFEPFAFVQAER